MSDKTLTSVARKRSIPKGCNWAPSCSDEVDSNSCLEQMDKIMGKAVICSVMWFRNSCLQFQSSIVSFVSISINRFEKFSEHIVNILPGTQVSNTENPTLHKNLSAPKESDITIASANLQIDEISDSVIVQSTWPKIN
jgi:hypothetical protein